MKEYDSLGKVGILAGPEFFVREVQVRMGVLAGILISSGNGAMQMHAQTAFKVTNGSGIRLVVESEDTQPVLRVVLPGFPDADRSIRVIFPEHVTARRTAGNEAEHLYLFQPGQQGDKPAWRETGNALEYERELRDGIHFLARATLEEDGVLFHYEFTNNSPDPFEMIYAVTDPRLTGILHDVRLERTYVHHADGFALLAAETPGRVSIPLREWLPARYLDSFTWPVPEKRVDHREDGITYYNKSRPVDEPMIATISTDQTWVVASFTRTVGNVWSNPELTCQHVDPAAQLAAGGRAVLEVKMLVLRGDLDGALRKVVAQREKLR